MSRCPYTYPGGLLKCEREPHKKGLHQASPLQGSIMYAGQKEKIIWEENYTSPHEGSEQARAFHVKFWRAFVLHPKG